jgi:aminoglycoside 6'-N-acetyltransferase I
MANASLQIEHAGPDHLEPALELLRRFFAEEGFTTPPEQIRVNLRAFLDERRYAAFLAHLGGAPVGVLTLSTSVSVELGRMAEIDDLYVLPAARNAGIAKALIRAALEWCRAKGCLYVQATVTPEGEAAHGLTGFYAKLGFADTERKLLSHILAP